MYLVAEKQFETAVQLSDVQSISVLGIESGFILLFTGTYAVASRSSKVESFIAGVNLVTGEQKIYHRLSTATKVIHASINNTQTICCFVVQTETTNYEVIIVQINPENLNRRYTFRYNRPDSVKAYLTASGCILLLFCRSVKVFPLSGREKVNQDSKTDGGLKLDDCIYYQWDTLNQTLHVIQRDSQTTNKDSQDVGQEPMIYTAYTISIRAELQKTITAKFQLQAREAKSSIGNFTILSSVDSLYICWQSSIKQETSSFRYTIISLGHGRTVRVEKKINAENLKLFQSKKLTFGLLSGNYVFVSLRGDIVHLIDFNAHSNFQHNMFLNDDDRLSRVPYNIRYISQRGLGQKFLTLGYDRRSLTTYLIRIDPMELIEKMTSKMIYPVISYVIIGLKSTAEIMFLLRKILHEKATDFQAKSFLQELLTALRFSHLSTRFPQTKYCLAFPSTTIEGQQHKEQEYDIDHFDAKTHHRDQVVTDSKESVIDRDHFCRLETFFECSRKFRRKINIYHDSSQHKKEHKASSNLSISAEIQCEQIRNNVVNQLQKMYPTTEKKIFETIAAEYIQQTFLTCNTLSNAFMQIVGYDRSQLLHEDLSDNIENLRKLLLILEKLGFAIEDWGFPRSSDLDQTLLNLSFHILPFDQFIESIDYKLLKLSEEFVTRVIKELDNEPKSYAKKEQLIRLLPPNDDDIYCRLFAEIDCDKARRTTAQLLLNQRFRSADKRELRTTPTKLRPDELMSNESQNDSSSRRVAVVAITFYEDCCERGILKEEDFPVLKSGLRALIPKN